MKNPAHEEEQLHIPVHAGVQTVGKQLRKEGPGGPVGLQVDQEPVMHPHCKQGQWHLWLH